MFKLLSILLLPVFFFSFAMASVQPGNMTGLTFQLVALSRATGEHAGNGSSYTTEELRLPISTSPRFAYGVFVSIGTGDGARLKVLGLDTAANTSWVMCEPYRPLLPQVGHLFSPAASPTFRGVRGDDPVCTAPYRRTANGCSFRIPFAHDTDGASAGYLSRDTFHLHRGRSGAAVESVPGVVFGCAHSAVGFRNDGTLGGALSLSHSPLSLLTQLGASAGGRFSYCLPKPTPRNPHGFLRLGADVETPPPPHARTTRFTVHPGVPGYYLSLVGISLGDKRLHIGRRVFAGRRPGEGGCSINPAETVTEIVQPAYLAVESALVAHMAQLGSDRVAGPLRGTLYFDRMYPSVRARLPDMVFNFEDGAELRVMAERLFEVHGLTAGFLVVGRGHRRTVIGAAQQVDTRFTFDVTARRLAFAPEQCG